MRSLVLVAAFASMIEPRRAEAWGIGAPVGPTGCEGDHSNRAWFVGASAGGMRSTLDFGDDAGELDITQYAVTATVGHAWPTWSVRAAVGVILDGRLEHAGRTHDIGPGIVASLGVARRFPFGAYFLDAAASASFGRTTTREGDGPTETLVAIDILRAGITAGRTFGIVSPYALARVFGGPVLWHLDDTDLTGTDTHKFQLGAGVSITSGRWTIVVDVAALGEQGASLGVARRL